VPPPSSGSGGGDQPPVGLHPAIVCVSTAGARARCREVAERLATFAIQSPEHRARVKGKLCSARKATTVAERQRSLAASSVVSTAVAMPELRANKQATVHPSCIIEIYVVALNKPRQRHETPRTSSRYNGSRCRTRRSACCWRRSTLSLTLDLDAGDLSPHPPRPAASRPTALPFCPLVESLGLPRPVSVC